MNSPDPTDNIITFKPASEPRYDADGELIDCALCGSERVVPYVGAVPTLIPGIKVAAEKGGGWYYCRQCGNHFNMKRARFGSWPIALFGSALAGGAVLCLYWLIEWLRWL